MEVIMNSPSQELAKIIVEKLVKHKLLLSDDSAKMTTGFTTGNLKQEDWRLIIEKAIDAEANHE
jgi:hypothetical protein